MPVERALVLVNPGAARTARLHLDLAVLALEVANDVGLLMGAIVAVCAAVLPLLVALLFAVAAQAIQIAITSVAFLRIAMKKKVNIERN